MNATDVRPEDPCYTDLFKDCILRAGGNMEEVGRTNDNGSNYGDDGLSPDSDEEDALESTDDGAQHALTAFWSVVLEKQNEDSQ